jgi:hypothetical protein
MRLYGAIQKVEPQDDGTVRVHGIASSEVTDDQGEIIRAEAMRAAVPDYMRFPALREMHQLSAAGTTLEAEVGDDGATRIVAHVVDPVAVAKVRNQVYRGFSIGGRVTQREAGNPKVITGLVLDEISLVDRPANPEAIFDCWKAATETRTLCDEADSSLAAAISSAVAREPFNPPIQIWACGVPDHHHRAKGDAVKCLETRALEAPDFSLKQTAPAFFAAPPEPKPEAGSPGGTKAAIDAAKTAIETAEGALAKFAPGGEQGADGHGNVSATRSSLGSRKELNYADHGYQSDGKRRYPIDTERHIRAAWSYINRPGNTGRYTAEQVKQIKANIIAAWKEKIDIEGPPSAKNDEKASYPALTKAFWDVGRMAQIILELDWLRELIEVEAVMDGDDSSQPARVQALITELCDFLNELVAEEADEILDDTQLEAGSCSLGAPELLAMAAGGRGAVQVAAPLKIGNSKMQKLAAGLLGKAKHSQGDQALADMAHYACDRCIKIGDLSAEEEQHMDRARDHLRKAGAVPLDGSSLDVAGGFGNVASQMRPPLLDFDPGDNATVDTSKRLGSIAAMRSKRGRAHQNLMDLAHECVSKLTDAMACSDLSPSSELRSTPEGSANPEGVKKIGARHSAEMMSHLRAAHAELVVAGAECGAADIGEEELEGTEFESVKALPTRDLAKVLAGERAEKTALVKALSDMVPLLDRLSRRVDDIARTPLPPLTIARGSVSVSKQQDGGTGTAVDGSLSPEAIASALAKMSKEEQTLTLIKASYANPITVHGAATDER